MPPTGFTQYRTGVPPVGRGDAPKAAPDVAIPSAERSRNMAAIRRTDTGPELRLRSALHAVGLRFRKDYPIRVEGRIVRPVNGN